MKFAVIGGGSTYTPELVAGLAGLPFDEVALVDPDTDRLEIVAGLARRMLARLGHPGRVTATADLDPAVDGAAAVLLQLRVGGQTARLGDETWPLDCGCVGQETTGAGGLAKALRTVPVVLSIARRVRDLAPAAWIIDFTNPVGIVTRALLDDGHRAIGLCNVAIGFEYLFAGLLGCGPEQVTLDHVGLNHLTWERAVRVDGADVLGDLIARHGAAIADDIELPADLLTELGAVPSYYLRYYYAHDQVVARQRREPPRAEVVAGIERRLLDMYADPGLAEKPALLDQRGGAHYSEAAVRLLTVLLGDGATPGPSRGVQVLNVRNAGTLPFLPDDAVIEVPARIGGPDGPRPLPVEPLRPLFAGLVAHVSAYEELAVEAATRGGRARVEEALLAHPLVGQRDLARGLADRLIAHNRAYLAWA